MAKMKGLQYQTVVATLPPNFRQASNTGLPLPTPIVGVTLGPAPNPLTMTVYSIQREKKAVRKAAMPPSTNYTRREGRQERKWENLWKADIDIAQWQ